MATPAGDTADHPARADTPDRRLLLSFMEIASATAGAENLEVLLDTLARALGRLFPVDGAALGLCEEDGIVVRQIVREGGADRREPERLPADRSHLLGWVLGSGRPLWRNDIRTELRFAEGLPGDGMRSDMVIPLRARGRIMGVFRVACRRSHAFDPADFEVLQRCADLTAVAVETQRLLMTTRRLAELDGVTGVFNHRHFVNLLVQEVERAGRLGRPLSLLMIDIDNFKRINDTCGHQSGDEVLRQVAREVSRTLRRSDAVARYGGEEFAVVLQDALAPDADGVAEKIRAAIAGGTIDVPFAGRPLHVTVSIGVATYPDDARNPPELVAVADRGLYQAKRTGRNRVSRFGLDQAPGQGTPPPARGAS